LPLRAFIDIGGSGALADAFTIWIVQWVGQEIGTTPPLKGDVSNWCGLIISFYFGRRTFENVARIIKR
jgi:hypothetical protein